MRDEALTLIRAQDRVELKLKLEVLDLFLASRASASADVNIEHCAFLSRNTDGAGNVPLKEVVHWSDNAVPIHVRGKLHVVCLLVLHPESLSVRW